MVGLVQILGGLALFLFGINMLSSGIEKLAGDQIQKWLDKVTNNRVKSAVFGSVATALVQSSSLIMVTMIGLINANLMTVEQAISVMLGQEIGTTMTTQIVSFHVGDFRLILIIAGLIFLEFFPKRDWKKFGEILMGLGIIFVGMGYMSSALDSLIEITWIANALLLGKSTWLGVLAGTVLTGVTQSSSAVSSLVVAMGLSQAITLRGAIGIILGANIGTCITGLIASLKLSPTARQASIAQIIINISGVLIFLPFITPFANLIQGTSGILARQIANAHSIFNVAVSVILFPFTKQIASIAKSLAPVDPQKEKEKPTKYIDENQYAVPSVAINEASRELLRLGEVTSEMITLSCQALLEKDMSKAERVLRLEDDIVDPVSRELERFINTLMRSTLSNAQQNRSFQIKNLLVDIERVGDMAEDIAQFAQDRAMTDIPFSDEAVTEFNQLWQEAHRTYSLSLQAFQNKDHDLAKEVCCIESEFDNTYLIARQNHIQRLETGCCKPKVDVLYTETLRLLERISDHADNIGISVLQN
ncbi:MAG: Na/Pi cotransporter family protein [Brevefilum sp.]|nr:Na/Pi cotransporter family protein [Brevefilum sp.]